MTRAGQEYFVLEVHLYLSTICKVHGLGMYLSTFQRNVEYLYFSSTFLKVLFDFYGIIFLIQKWVAGVNCSLA